MKYGCLFLALCSAHTMAALAAYGGTEEVHADMRTNALPKESLLVCGAEEVSLLAFASHNDGAKPTAIWTWRANDDAFECTDECKPFEDGRKILVTSSWRGGVALVERTENRVLFSAEVPNAHSADLLPHHRIAVAASHAADGGGDRLLVYDLNLPQTALLTTPLPWGHGVVWDAKRETLYALSGDDLRLFTLKNWSSDRPELVETATFDLPEPGGHDLADVPGTSFLSVTTGNHCWLLDRDAPRFIPHPDLADVPTVKSISTHPDTGRIAYVQATQGAFSDTIRFLHPTEKYVARRETIYKARWAKK